jgi:hypothetical protein
MGNFMSSLSTTAEQALRGQRLDGETAASSCAAVVFRTKIVFAGYVSDPKVGQR